MANIARIRAQWLGFIGGPGVSTFYATDGAEACLDIRAWFESMKNGLPNVLTIHMETSGDIINDATGDLTGSWVTAGAVADVDCLNTESYAAPVGLTVNWNTNVILGGRRLRGKTFLVPWASGGFTTAGAPSSVTRGFLDGWNTALISAHSNNLRAYHKGPGGTGTSAPIVSGITSPKAAVLRSRRD